jgi:hypothetical protein
MDKTVAIELLRIIDRLIAECKLTAQKAEALEFVMQNQTPYAVGYNHALGRVHDPLNLGNLSEAVANLREEVLQTP